MNKYLIIGACLFLWQCTDQKKEQKDFDQSEPKYEVVIPDNPLVVNMSAKGMSVLAEAGRVIKPTRNADGGYYSLKRNKDVAPGDTVYVKGAWKYFRMDSLIGTPAARIKVVFDSAIIGHTTNQYGSAVMSLYSRYVDFIDKGGSYVGATGSNFISQAFGLAYSSDWTIDGFEIARAQAGVFSNATTGGSFKNIKILNCYFHHFDNHDSPFPNNRWNSAGIYIGTTAKGTWGAAWGFENVEIAYNRFDSSTADAMQLSMVRTLNVHDNYITNYGTVNAPGQQASIVVGGCTDGIIKNNKIENGSGAAISIFGGGVINIESNTIGKNVATTTGEYVIYINGKCSGTPAVVNLRNNIVEKHFAGMYFRDESKSIASNTGNTWGAATPPPLPTRKLIAAHYLSIGKILSVFDDGTTELK